MLLSIKNLHASINGKEILKGIPYRQVVLRHGEANVRHDDVCGLRDPALEAAAAAVLREEKGIEAGQEIPF